MEIGPLKSYNEAVGLDSKPIGILIRRGDGDIHRERHQGSNTEESQQVGQLQAKKTGFRRNQLAKHLTLGLPATRTLSK